MGTEPGLGEEICNFSNTVLGKAFSFANPKRSYICGVERVSRVRGCPGARTAHCIRLHVFTCMVRGGAWGRWVADIVHDGALRDGALRRWVGVTRRG